MKFIAFDLETTGTIPGIDKIVEIGAIRFENGVPEAVFSTLVNPCTLIPKSASDVNNITNDMVANKPTIEKFLNPFAKFCGLETLVAHNANFDAQFLIHDIKKHHSLAPQGIILDTLSMSRKIFPGFLNYKLSTLIKNLKIQSHNDFHRAEQDAKYCGEVFLKIIQRISPQKTPKIEDLISLNPRSSPLQFPQLKPKAIQLDFF